MSQLTKLTILLLAASMTTADDAAAVTALPSPLLKLDFPCPITSSLNNLFQAKTIVQSFRATDYSAFQCSPQGHGLTLNKRASLYSTGDNAVLFDQMKSGFTFEAWITPDIFPFQNKTIFSFAEGLDREYPYQPVRCDKFEFRVYVDDRTLKIEYTDNSRCKQIRVDTIRLDPKPTHVAITVYGEHDGGRPLYLESDVEVYVNARRFVPRIGRDQRLTSSLWQWRGDTELYLFDNMLGEYDEHPNQSWFRGTLHSLAIYGGYSDANTVRSLYQSGFVENEASQPTPAPVQMTTLEATPNDDLVGEEGKVLTFQLGVSASREADLMIEILSEPINGGLSRGPRDLKKGSRIGWNGLDEVKLSYSTFDQHFFSLPSRTAGGDFLEITPDSFQYRVIELGERGSILVSSKTATQILRVRNINDEPQITGPKFAQAASSSGEHTVKGVEVTDEDHDANMVRVDVISQNVEIGLRESVNAIFGGCQALSSDWDCERTSVKLVFLAEPSKVGSVLDRMTVKLLDLTSEGLAIVRIYDGIGGNCLSKDQHTMFGGDLYSIRNGCYAKELKVGVRSNHLEVDVDEGETSGNLWLAWAAGFGGILLGCWLAMKRLKNSCTKPEERGLGPVPPLNRLKKKKIVVRDFVERALASGHIEFSKSTDGESFAMINVAAALHSTPAAGVSTPQGSNNGDDIVKIDVSRGIANSPNVAFTTIDGERCVKINLAPTEYYEV